MRRASSSRPIIRTSIILALASTLVLAPGKAIAASENPTLAEANRLAAKKAYQEAEKLYLKVLAETPENAPAHHMFGRVLALQGKLEEALLQYRVSLKEAPKDAALLNDVGVALSVIGMRELGAKFLHQAIVNNSKYAAALNNFGVTLDRLGAHRQACEAYTRSLEIQPTNTKIRELLQKSEAKMADSKDFDFGLPVSWKDIPESFPKESETPEPPDTVATAQPRPKRVYKSKITPDEEEENKFLQEQQPLFMELRSKGFEQALVSGTGLVQVGNKSDSADATRELDLAKDSLIEVSGEVILDLVGKGTLSLGNALLEAKDPECMFSVNTGNNEITCYAGIFTVSGWNSVQATRATAKVQVEADNCNSVYGQDDSRVDAKNCGQVALVGYAQGTMVNCQKVVLNDKTRAVAAGCKKLTVMAQARAKASDCDEIEELDQAKVETGTGKE